MNDVEPTQPAWLDELSRFIQSGFAQSPGCAYFAPAEVLRWKLFAPRGPWTRPRSFVVREGGRIQAHLGILPSALVRTGGGPEVEVSHTADWLTADPASFHGASLMLESFASAPVLYALGCSPAARKVMLAGGYREVRQVPLYHKVRAPWQPAVWRELHGRFQVWPGAALLAADLAQTARGLLSRPGRGLTARRVREFGSEPAAVLAAFDRPLTCSSRHAGLLNHLLAHPAGCMSGWVLEREGRLRGFAVLSLLRRWETPMARLVDLFLDTGDLPLWREALGVLESEAWQAGAGVLSAYGSTPWMEAALQHNGFFRRGRTSFYLRDPDGLVDCSGPVHLTHLEADLAYI